MNNQTGVNWLVEKLNQCEPWYSGRGMNEKLREHINDLINQAKQIEEQKMLEFHNWMLRHDTFCTLEDAEKYFGYSDKDMLREFLNQQQ